MEPWLSWTLALGIGGGAAYYYTQTGKPQGVKAQEKTQSATSKRRQDKSQSTSNPQHQSNATGNALNDTSSSKKRKGRSKNPQQDKSATSVERAEAVTVSEPEDEDQAWAEQLRAAQKGVTVNGNSKAGKSGRSGANKQADNGIGSGPDSKISQTAQAEQMRANTVSRDSGPSVADMLEPAAAGPSVLRLTGEAKSQKPKARAVSPEKETKKQRQNRKKMEEKKAAREQDEQERKVLQENQRRTAREARGESAKNGVPAVQPAVSAWSDKSKPARSAAVNGNKSATDQISSEDNSLLDTFDHDTLSNTSSNEPLTNSTTPASNVSNFGNELLSEQSQRTMFKEMDDAGWNEVSKGKKGKKKTTAQPEAAIPDRVNGTQSAQAADSGKIPGPPPTAVFGGYGDDFVKGMTSKKFHEGDSDWFVE